MLAAIEKATVFVKVEVAAGELCSGSGFVVKTDDDVAYVVTNHHVIDPKLIEIVAEWRSGPRDAVLPHGRYGHGPRRPVGPPSLTPRIIARSLKVDEVTVVFQSNTPQEQSLKAEVLAADPEVDLAVLKVPAVKNLPAPVDCKHNVALSETMPVYVFGFPFGQVLATSKGSPAITIGKASISSLRLDDAGELALVQIDGALNPGNSGGPVVDTHGRLVGVAVATIKNSTGIGLAIPCKEVPEVLSGRLGKPSLHVSHDAEGAAKIEVEANLADPFHKIKSVTLSYLPADRVKEKPKPADHLQDLPGCRTASLKIQDHAVLGHISLKPRVKQVRVLCQGVAVDEGGRRHFTESVEETLTVPTADVADDTARPEPADAGGAAPSPSKPASSTGGASRSTNDLAALLKDLDSGDLGRRSRAIVRLRRLKPQVPNRNVAEALERILTEDSNPALRAQAAYALAELGHRGERCRSP